LNRPSVIHAGRPIHLLTKPVGPVCNLDCQYGFYLDGGFTHFGARDTPMLELASVGPGGQKNLKTPLFFVKAPLRRLPAFT
jgi:hypothetical protein